MEREYTYAELCRMKKKRVLRIAGFKNIKDAIHRGFNREISHFEEKFGQKMPVYNGVNLSKKYIARMIASDR